MPWALNQPINQSINQSIKSNIIWEQYCEHNKQNYVWELNDAQIYEHFILILPIMLTDLTSLAN